jgi:hypothetical protein
MSVQIDVWANLEENAHQGTRHAPDALRVESNAGAREIEASLNLHLRPKLCVQAQELVFKEAQEQVLVLENAGYGNLRAEVTPSEDWITVNRRNWTIKAAKKARLTVSLSDAPENAQGSIEIRSASEVVLVPITLKRDAP